MSLFWVVYLIFKNNGLSHLDITNYRSIQGTAMEGPIPSGISHLEGIIDLLVKSHTFVSLPILVVILHDFEL